MSARVMVPADASAEDGRVHRPREPRVLVLEVSGAMADLAPASTAIGAPRLRDHLPRLAQLRGVARASGEDAREAVRTWARERDRPLAERAVLAFVLAEGAEAETVLREVATRISAPGATVLALTDAADAALVADVGARLLTDHFDAVLERAPSVLLTFADRPEEAGRVVLAWLAAAEALVAGAPAHMRRVVAPRVGRALDLVALVGTPEVAAAMAGRVGKTGEREDVARFFKRFPELAEGALRPLVRGRGKVRDAAQAMLLGLGPAASAARADAASALAAALPDHGAPDHGAPDHGAPDRGAPDHAPTEPGSSPPSPEVDEGPPTLADPPWRSWSRSGLLVLETPPSPIFDLPPDATAKHDREAWSQKLPSVPRQLLFSSRAARAAAHAWHAAREERAGAEAWLETFAPIAIYGLIPFALGEPGPARTEATGALRFACGHLPEERVTKIVERWADDAGAADRRVIAEGVRGILVADARWDCPSRAPSWPTWLAREALPVVRTRAGVPLSDTAMRHLVELMIWTAGSAGGAERVREHPCVREVRDALDPASLGALSLHVHTQSHVLGQSARASWPLEQIALFGGRSATRALAAHVRGLATDRELSRALEALSVLARVPHESGLVHLASLAETAKNERVRREARRLLEAAGAERGLRPEELEDVLVPDLGLDDRGELTLDYGPRRVTVRLDARLEPVLLDESGARLSQVPRPSKADVPEKAAAALELYKALKADAESAAKGQLRRFERAMCSGRTWSRASFETRLVQHPLLRPLVSGLVWSVGEGAVTFRVAEDRTLAGVDDAAVVLAEGALVRLPHPLELAPALCARWGDLLGDYQIVQPFPQLAREVFLLEPSERAASQLARIVGRKGEVGNVYALEQRGWAVRGSRSWVSTLAKRCARAHVVLQLAEAVDLAAPKNTPIVTAVSLTVAPIDAGASASFADLEPVEASEVLRDLAFLV